MALTDREKSNVLKKLEDIKESAGALSLSRNELVKLEKELSTLESAYKNDVTSMKEFAEAQSALARRTVELSESTKKSNKVFDDLFESFKNGYDDVRNSFNEFIGMMDVTSPENNIKFWRAYDQRIRDVAVTYGFAINKIDEFAEANRRSEKAAAEAGISAEIYKQSLENLFATTDRAVMDSDFGKYLADISKSIGLSESETAKFIGQTNILGLNLKNTGKILEDLRYSAEKSALNTNKVLSTFTQNFEKLNTYSFKNGVQGMMDMVKQSVNLRLNMDNILQLSDEFLDPEKTMEFAANMQMLGGSYAQLGDFNQLMYDAAVAPEELAKNISRAVGEMGSFDRATGKFTISPVDRMQMKQFSQMTRMGTDELNRMASTAAKIKDIKVAVNFKEFTPEQYDTLGALAEFDTDKGEYVVKMKDEKGEEVKKAIASLTEVDFQKLLEEKQKTTLEEQRVAKMEVGALTAAKFEGMKYETPNIPKTLGLTDESVRKSINEMMGTFSSDIAKELKDNIFTPIENFGKEFVSQNLPQVFNNLGAAIKEFKDDAKDLVSAVGSLLPKEVQDEYKRLRAGEQKKEKGDILTTKYAEGDILKGLSHSQGGIPFTIDGKPGFEAEGGEVLLTKGVSKDPDLLSAASKINEAAGGKKLYADGGVVTDTTKVDKYNINNTFDLTKFNKSIEDQIDIWEKFVNNNISTNNKLILTLNDNLKTPKGDLKSNNTNQLIVQSLEVQNIKGLGDELKKGQDKNQKIGGDGSKLENLNSLNLQTLEVQNISGLNLPIQDKKIGNEDIERLKSLLDMVTNQYKNIPKDILTQDKSKMYEDKINSIKKELNFRLSYQEPKNNLFLSKPEKTTEKTFTSEFLQTPTNLNFKELKTTIQNQTTKNFDTFSKLGDTIKNDNEITNQNFKNYSQTNKNIADNIKNTTNISLGGSVKNEGSIKNYYDDLKKTTNVSLGDSINNENAVKYYYESPKNRSTNNTLINDTFKSTISNENFTNILGDNFKTIDQSFKNAVSSVELGDSFKTTFENIDQSFKNVTTDIKLGDSFKNTFEKIDQSFKNVSSNIKLGDNFKTTFENIDKSVKNATNDVKLGGDINDYKTSINDYKTSINKNIDQSFKNVTSDIKLGDNFKTTFENIDKSFKNVTSDIKLGDNINDYKTSINKNIDQSFKNATSDINLGNQIKNESFKNYDNITKNFTDYVKNSTEVKMGDSVKNVGSIKNYETINNISNAMTPSMDKISKIQGGLVEKRVETTLGNVTMGGSIGGKIDVSGTIKIEGLGGTKEIQSESLKKEIVGHVEKMIGSQNKNLLITQMTQKGTGIASPKKQVIPGITDVGDRGVASWFS